MSPLEQSFEQPWAMPFFDDAALHDMNWTDVHRRGMSQRIYHWECLSWTVRLGLEADVST
jgi:hypothetical protein